MIKSTGDRQLISRCQAGRMRPFAITFHWDSNYWNNAFEMAEKWTKKEKKLYHFENRTFTCTNLDRRPLHGCHDPSFNGSHFAIMLIIIYCYWKAIVTANFAILLQYTHFSNFHSHFMHSPNYIVTFSERNSFTFLMWIVGDGNFSVETT